jgi:RimJ/RimL family protein N-acetyltransferase
MFQPLITKRLILRRLVPADAEALFAYRADPEVMRYQNWEPAYVEEVRVFIMRLEGKEPIMPGKWFQLGIILRDTGELVGDCGIHPSADEVRQVELGITLAPLAQGRGFATEALNAVFGYLFTQTETHRVTCSVDPRNLPCLKLLQNVGMRQEAHMIESLWIKGAWADDVIFAILKKEWEAIRRRG